jgi:hypothetical protein
MENLYIEGHLEHSISLFWTRDRDVGPFTAVKTLYLSMPLWLNIVPALQNLLLQRFQRSKPLHEGIRQFISARQLINRPVAISLWERERGSDVY